MQENLGFFPVNAALTTRRAGVSCTVNFRQYLDALTVPVGDMQ